MTNIFLIRHGDVNNPDKILYGRKFDFELNETGKFKIKRLASSLKDEGIVPTIIYTSPMTRAYQTAEVINEQYGLAVPINSDERLQEGFCPVIEGIKLEEVDKMGDVYAKYPNPDQMESANAIVDRMMQVIEDARQDHKDETVFIVGHADPLLLLEWKLRNPDKTLPSILEVIKTVQYLEKGQAMKIAINSEGKVLEVTQLNTGIEGKPSGENIG